MSDPDENINAILSAAANDLNIPTPIAQVFMRVGAELARLRDEVSHLRELAAGHERRTADQAREIKRLQGVHGA